MLVIPVKAQLSIHIVGAGGTGGYTAEYLTRLLAGEDGHEIHLYDGDIVEGKNLKRQNFYPDDLEKKKTDVLQQKLCQIHGAPEISSHPEYLTDAKSFALDILTELKPEQSLLVISAVDNIATRKLINEAVLIHLRDAKTLTIALDSGNHDQGGQVCVFANAPVRNRQPFKSDQIVALPTMLDLFPEMAKVKDHNPGEGTICEDAAEEIPQAMMANIRNGELLAWIVSSLKKSYTLPGNLWTSDLITGNTICSFKQMPN